MESPFEEFVRQLIQGFTRDPRTMTPQGSTSLGLGGLFGGTGEAFAQTPDRSGLAAMLAGRAGGTGPTYTPDTSAMPGVTICFADGTCCFSRDGQTCAA